MNLLQLWHDRFDVIFPRVCVHCADVVEEGSYRHLCPLCARRLLIVAAPHCTTCGHV